MSLYLDKFDTHSKFNTHDLPWYLPMSRVEQKETFIEEITNSVATVYKWKDYKEG